MKLKPVFVSHNDKPVQCVHHTSRFSVFVIEREPHMPNAKIGSFIQETLARLVEV